MNLREAVATDKPYRRKSYAHGAWFYLTSPYTYFSETDCLAEDWEVDNGPPTVTLTEGEVYTAVTKAYEELLSDRRNYGYLIATFPVLPNISIIVKHLGFK